MIYKLQLSIIYKMTFISANLLRFLLQYFNEKLFMCQRTILINTDGLLPKFFLYFGPDAAVLFFMFYHIPAISSTFLQKINSLVKFWLIIETFSRKDQRSCSVIVPQLLLKLKSFSSIYHISISQHSSTHLWQVNFAPRQVDLQLTCPDGHVEILEKYQKYCNSFLLHFINFEVLLWFKSKLGKFIFIWAS